MKQQCAKHTKSSQTKNTSEIEKKKIFKKKVQSQHEEKKNHIVSHK